MVLGDIPATGHFGDGAALRGPALTSPEEATPGLLDLAARHLRTANEGMLVVYPEWQAEQAKRLMRLTRGMLDSDQVASIGLKLPPLACSVVADLLSLSAPHLQIGYLAGLGRRLEKEIMAGARLATVAKLGHIETKLTEHMASFSPGSGFLGWVAPDGRIDKISKRKPLRAPEFRPTDPVHLLVSPQGTDFPEFEKELTANLRPQVVKTVAAQPLGETYWGTRKHVEFVAFSAHTHALSEIVRGTRFWMCRWCRQPASLEICAICGMFQEPAKDAAARAPETAPRTVPRGPGLMAPAFPTKSEPAKSEPAKASAKAKEPAAAPSGKRTPKHAAADERAVPFRRRRPAVADDEPSDTEDPPETGSPNGAVSVSQNP